MNEREFSERLSAGSESVDLQEHFFQLIAQLAECDCASVLENLCELLDHAMPQELERLLLAHTETCEECGAAVHAEVRFREVLRRSCCEQAPQELRMKITRICGPYQR